MTVLPRQVVLTVLALAALLAAAALSACAGEEGDGRGGGTMPEAAAGPERPRATAPAADGGQAGEKPAAGGAGAPSGEPAHVVRAVDGDTIEVIVGGRAATVRYIGVDTPETSHPTVGVECFGREARDRNRALVEGRTVVLERDVSEMDRYGRLLRYVYLEDGTFVNERLVREGYAVVATYPPDVREVDRFRAAEREARAAGRGLWGACGGADTPAGQGPPPPTAAGPPPAGPSSGNCHPSYPSVCIPPPPSDLDCADIPARGFTVLPPDPHRLDRDRDGVGCER